MRDVSVHVKVSWKVYGVFDTVENRTRLPSALGQILQRLSAHRTMRESSLGIGMGGYLTCRGTVGVGSRNRCSHQGVCKCGVPPERELGQGWKDGGERWIILYEGPVFM